MVLVLVVYYYHHNHVDFCMVFNLKGGPSVPAFVILYTSMDYQTKLPTQLHNTTRMLVMSLSPRSKAYKQFFEQVTHS